MISDQKVVGCDRWTFPNTIRTGIKWSLIYEAGDLCQKGSPVFFCEDLGLGRSFQCSSHAFDKSLYNTILMAGSWNIPVPVKRTRKFFTNGTLNFLGCPILA